ncbi:hypothetical protein NKL07_20360 [Mesorhizobium sp. C280B]|uniref:hypothetical protein n=1 Tax=Mesorhizobium sp. C280B TaxID=2956828 RepID=UPI00333D511F
MRDPVRQRVGLAGAGAGNHQQRPGDLAVAMFDGKPLLGVELRQIGRLEGRITGGEVHRPSSIVSALFATFAEPE